MCEDKMNEGSKLLLSDFVKALATRLRRCPVRGSGFAAEFVLAQGPGLVEDAAADVGINLVAVATVEAVPEVTTEVIPEVPPEAEVKAKKARRRHVSDSK